MSGLRPYVSLVLRLITKVTGLHPLIPKTPSYYQYKRLNFPFSAFRFVHILPTIQRNFASNSSNYKKRKIYLILIISHLKMYRTIIQAKTMIISIIPYNKITLFY